MEERYVINGGKPLTGRVTISGAKNSAVAILPATVLARGVFILNNVPDISDITELLAILEKLGATYSYPSPFTVRIDTRNVSSQHITMDMTEKLRASYYFWGALLARFGYSDVCPPGGCKFCDRPYDLHTGAFKALGAEVYEWDCRVIVSGSRLKGCEILFPKISVGATINAMLAAVGAEGTTVLKNVAKEPHVIDVANFLSLMGADIIGAGTDTIKINGGKELRAVEYTIVPDQIEAGTYLVAAAATRGDVTVCNVIPEHLDSIITKLREIGCKVEESDSEVHLSCPYELVSCTIETNPHPGFPTDMQAMFCTLLTTCRGYGIVRDNIFPQRFQYTRQLCLMGADIEWDETDAKKPVFVRQSPELHGAVVVSDDLRAGAAMIIAGLVAKGETQIRQIEYIERGYEDIVGKFTSLGADIRAAEV